MIGFKFKYYVLLELAKHKALYRHRKSARRVIELSTEILKSLRSISTQRPQETLEKYLDTVSKTCEEYEEFCALIPSIHEVGVICEEASRCC